MSSTEPALSLQLARQIADLLDAEHRARAFQRASPSELLVVPIHGPLSLAFRGLYLQFLEMPMDVAVTIPSFMDPECVALHFGTQPRRARVSSTAGADARTDLSSWLRSDAHAYAYASLSPELADAHASGGADNGRTRLVLRHLATSESEVRQLLPRAPALWVGGALERLHVGDFVVWDDQVASTATVADGEVAAEQAVACRMLHRRRTQEKLATSSGAIST